MGYGICMGRIGGGKGSKRDGEGPTFNVGVMSCSEVRRVALRIVGFL